EADKKRREDIDLRNEADQMVFTTDKTIKDLGENVSDEEKQKAEDAKEALKQALEGEDMEDIKTKKEALEEEVQTLTTKVYEQMAQEQQAQKGEEEGKIAYDVEDNEYQEEDDEDTAYKE